MSATKTQKVKTVKPASITKTNDGEQKLKNLIESTTTLLKCISDNCKKEQAVSTAFLNKEIGPLRTKLIKSFGKKYATEDQKKEERKKILTEIREKMTELTKHRIVLELQECSAKHCSEKTRINVKNATEIFKEQCKTSKDPKIKKATCNMQKYSENFAKKTKITGQDIAEYTQKERNLYF